MKELRLATCDACFHAIINGGVTEASYSLGCSEDVYLLLTGSKPWTVDEKFQVVNQLNALFTGTLQKLGLGEIMEVSSEYAASVIAIFVHPVNWFSACCWIGKTQANEDLANLGNKPEKITQLEYTTPKKLYALIIEIKATKRLDLLGREFVKKTRKQIGAYYETEEPISKKTT